MRKPTTIHGYNQAVTNACERVLVTLIRRLGSWRDSIFLVGGLTPRYLIKDQPPAVPAHAGTGDVDVLVDMNLLVDTQAYSTLEDNIRAIGFKRSLNDKDQRLSWRWQRQHDHGIVLILEFLADAGDAHGGALQELPSDGAVSAIHIPHSGMVFDHYETIEITAELLDSKGVATVAVRHADIVSFTCLKAFAFDHRAEPKDAHDLCYCLEHYKGGAIAVQAAFDQALEGNHADRIMDAIGILKNCFCDSDDIDGYLREGPVAAADFEGAQALDYNARILRQRDLSAVVQDVIGPFI